MSEAALSLFTRTWCHPDYVPAPVEAEDLLKAEEHLGWPAPASYRRAILACGLPSPTIELLDFICDHEIDLPDLSDFHTPDEIVTSTTDWREMGMPGNLVAFASDCSGNIFVFTTSPAESSGEVWFWDHDFGTSEKIADSFEAWLDCYNTLKA